MGREFSFTGLRFRILPLTIFAAFLMLTVRAGDVWRGFSQLANTVTSTAALADTAPAAGTAGGASHPAPIQVAELPPDPSRFSQSEIDLLQALATRRDSLDRREATLEQREAVIQAAEKRIAEKAAELQSGKQELQTLLDAYNTQEDNRLKSLVKIYEAMKPKDAAQIFDKLDNVVLIGVVERMKETRVAPILAAMDTDRAKQVTDELAQRKEAPSDDPAQQAAAQ